MATVLPSYGFLIQLCLGISFCSLAKIATRVDFGSSSKRESD